MKVLHLISSPKWTGPAVPTVNLCRELKKQGIYIDIAVSQYPGKPLSAIHGKLLDKVNEAGLVHRTDLQLQAKTFNFSWLSDLSKLRSDIKSKRYDLIHTNLAHDTNLVSIASIGFEKLTPIVYTHHTIHPWRNDLWHKYIITKKIDLVITRYLDACEDFHKRFSLGEDKVISISPGIDLSVIPEEISSDKIRSELGIEPDDLVIGMVARMQPKRDYETLLKAAALLHPKYPKLKVILIGSGEVSKSIENKIYEMQLQDVVVMAGFRHDDYWEALNMLEAKILTAPGSDASCRAVLEAMALGIPVVAANMGVLPELLDKGKCGILFEPGNSESLSDAIVPILEDSNYRKSLGKSSKYRVKTHYQINNQAKVLIENYKNIDVKKIKPISS